MTSLSSENPVARLLNGHGWNPGVSGATVIVTGVADIAVFALLFYAAELSLLAANTVAYATAATGGLGFALSPLARPFGGPAARRSGGFYAAIGLTGLAIANLALWLAATAVAAPAAKLFAVLAAMTWNHLGAAKLLDDD